MSLDKGGDGEYKERAGDSRWTAARKMRFEKDACCSLDHLARILRATPLVGIIVGECE